ncbi:g2620 [Coccomyxa viridis]|uniref:G2620 protein n=1 Tax=Coccomyxa viridis TaxID=1274662 RepID=A0ABP1FR95_9CHLO
MAKRTRTGDLSHLNVEALEEGISRRACHVKPPVPQPQPSLRGEWLNVLLLVTLYAMQGVPLGLTMGSMPFLLQAKASYTAIGIFSLASYPYSLKLLWSPIVDSIYSLAFGRRKSWVVPIQLASAALMLVSADWAESRLKEADIVSITVLFFVLVLLAATQDIAVDGWALTLLSRQNIGYASTCQTVGMNIGYFTSFTVFLALNDVDFCNTYLRSTPSEDGHLTLSTYLRVWGWVYAVVTLLVAAFKKEVNFTPAEELESFHLKLNGEDRGVGIMDSYKQLWGVVRLPAVRRLALVLLAFRLAVLPAEQAAPLKLLEKGVSKEALAGLVLIEFPCELVSAVVAGRWAASSSPFKPFLFGYQARVIMAGVVTTIVYYFPSGASSLSDHPRWFALLAVAGLVTSFTSTLMFTALGSFYTRISDPDMGGSYLTLLNTIANMGTTLPKLALFSLMDLLTTRKCVGADPTLEKHACPNTQIEGRGANPCTQAGGECAVARDGYYMLSYAMVTLGFLIFLWLRVLLPQLDAMPLERWRAKQRRH